MSQSVFPGPIAPQNNPPIEPQWFQPSRFPITNISLGPTTTVTMGTAFGVGNNYVVGQLVRLLVPPAYGSSQLDEEQAYVISIPSPNQVTLQLNTSMGVNAFIPNPPFSINTPSISAIGDVNAGAINSQGRSNNGLTIPGAFENISPAAGG